VPIEPSSVPTIHCDGSEYFTGVGLPWKIWIINLLEPYFIHQRIRLKVTFYTKEKCSLCELAYTMIIDLREDISFELKIVDITKSDDVWEAYHEMIPVVEIEEEKLWGRINESELLKLLSSKKYACARNSLASKI
jgi:glutaredoxin